MPTKFLTLTLTLALLTLALAVSAPAHAACTSPTGASGAIDYDDATRTTTICDGTNWKTLKEVDYSGTGSRERLQIANDTGSCTAAKLGRLRYDGASTWEYCNGSAWTPFKPPCADDDAGACWLAAARSSSDPQFTAANIASGVNILGVTGSYSGSANGYLVQTATKWNGNLGGLSGADGKCLTELQTTYDWKGKADAGTLSAARVKALLCDGTTCNNLAPDTVYLTAIANDTAKGGQGFRTDGSGLGPGSSWNWDQDNFSGASNVWTNRGGASGDSWLATPQGSTHCTNWSSGSSGQSGREGNAGWDDYRRWNEAADTCNTQNFLLCFVDP